MFNGSGELRMQHSDRDGYLTYAAYGPHGIISEQSYRLEKRLPTLCIPIQ
jgi:hypothetical protein